MQPRNEDDWDPGPIPRRVPAGSRRRRGKHGDTRSHITTAATTSESRRKVQRVDSGNEIWRHGVSIPRNRPRQSGGVCGYSGDVEL
ncbi:hypothetical protein QBC45DRAFT_314885, partial [Copromyces sp. CBS 386.78]